MHRYAHIYIYIYIYIYILYFVQGDDATVDEGKMQLQILQASNKIMDDSQVFRMPGQVPVPTAVGLWKLKRYWTIDGGKTVVKWC